MINIIMIALAISAISMTISQSYIFKPIRKYSKLLKCPYCLSHWLAFIGAYFIATSILDFVIISFALVTLASISSLPILIFLNLLEKNA